MDRQLIFYKNYFKDFYRKQDIKTKKKITFVLRIIQTLDRIPEEYFKFLKGSDGIYEIRVQLGNNIYRILCFFDEGNLVVLVNSFQKKTKKTDQIFPIR